MDSAPPGAATTGGAPPGGQVIELLLIGAAGVLVWWLAQRSIRDRKPTRPHGAGPRSLPRQTPNVADVLRLLLNRPDVLVIDVETTGLGERAEVLAVAVIDTTGRVLLDTVSLPQGQIPRGASDVNGLTRAKLRSMGARPWPALRHRGFRYNLWQQQRSQFRMAGAGRDDSAGRGRHRAGRGNEPGAYSGGLGWAGLRGAGRGPDRWRDPRGGAAPACRSYKPEDRRDYMTEDKEAVLSAIGDWRARAEKR